MHVTRKLHQRLASRRVTCDSLLTVCRQLAHRRITSLLCCRAWLCDRFDTAGHGIGRRSKVVVPPGMPLQFSGCTPAPDCLFSSWYCCRCNCAGRQWARTAKMKDRAPCLLWQCIAASTPSCGTEQWMNPPELAMQRPAWTVVPAICRAPKPFRRNAIYCRPFPWGAFTPTRAGGRLQSPSVAPNARSGPPWPDQGIGHHRLRSPPSVPAQRVLASLACLRDLSMSSTVGSNGSGIYTRSCALIGASCQNRCSRRRR
jgi:hypothetical protein